MYSSDSRRGSTCDVASSLACKSARGGVQVGIQV